MSNFAMQIGELARAAGVNIQTIRFYEREKLLPAPPRTASGYRDYSSVTYTAYCSSVATSKSDSRWLKSGQLLDLHGALEAMPRPLGRKPAQVRQNWRWLSRAKHVGGRKPVSNGLRGLILLMAMKNPTWGAPRIHGELLKPGFDLSEPTVSRWLGRVPRTSDPVQRWLTLLRNHREAIAAMDVFTVYARLWCAVLLFRHRVGTADIRDIVGCRFWPNADRLPAAGSAGQRFQISAFSSFGACTS